MCRLLPSPSSNLKRLSFPLLSHTSHEQRCSLHQKALTRLLFNFRYFRCLPAWVVNTYAAVGRQAAAFFMGTSIHDYWKSQPLTRQTFVGKVISLLFNMLSRLVCCTIALISHDSKVMLKILQARLQQYVNREIPDVQAGFRKVEDQIRSDQLLSRVRLFATP